MVQVVWPGREASDAMEREVLADPRLVSRLRGVRYERIEHDLAPPGIDDVMAGVGTLVFARDELIARHRGVASLRGLSTFLDDAITAARDRDSVRDREDDEATRVRARCDLRCGLAERAVTVLERLRAIDDRDRLLMLQARLDLGAVAEARELLDRLDRSDAARVPVELRARVMLAERMITPLLRMVREVPNRSSELDLLLARALLEHDERAEAQATLLRLSAVGDRIGAEAEAVLVESLGTGSAHAHASPATSVPVRR